MNLIPLKPNHRTADRERKRRLAERDRLIAKIGIDPDVAPLYSEELRFLAYQESLRK